jgi:hypothetical protein
MHRRKPCRTPEDSRLRDRPLLKPLHCIENYTIDGTSTLLTTEAMMKVLFSLFVAASMLSACVVSEHAPPRHNTTVVVPESSPRETTTVVVPEDSRTTVVCQDGTRPPCP